MVDAGVAFDIGAMDDMRDEVGAEQIESLVDFWDKALPWSVKDAIIMVLMDQSGEQLIPMMEDGLDSEIVETQAYALSILYDDEKLWDKMFDKGWVDEERVKEFIKNYWASK